MARTQLPILSIHRSRPMDITATSGRWKKPVKPTKKKPLIISASELRDFLRCRVRWAWRHQLRIVPREKPVALAFGGVGHQILEGWYNKSESERTVKAMRKIADRILQGTTPRELSKDDLDLLKAMCVGYAEWAKPRDRAMKMKNTEAEIFFDLPLLKDGSIRVRGVIDVSFEHGVYKKTHACIEHKFKKSIDMSIIDMNTQLSVYLWALRALVPKKRSYIAYYNVLRKQMPGPRVKADLFAREGVERTEDQIEQWIQDTRHTVLDMLDGAIYPNPMDSCSWDCDYQTPCMLRGTRDLKATLRSGGAYVNKDGTEIERE